jgi:ribosomal protein L12E/L44/L45/RPP1/RPP2
MVPTGTGFRDHHRTRVKKNIDFGDIGSTASFAPRTSDAELEALVAGLDPSSSEPAMILAATGSEGAAAGAGSADAKGEAGGAGSARSASSRESEDEVEEGETASK